MKRSSRRTIATLIAVILIAAGSTGLAWADEDHDRGRNKIYGTLNAVDLTEMTVTVGLQTFTLRPDAFVKVDRPGPDRYASVAELPEFVGSFVELKLDAQGQVYKVEIEFEQRGGDDDRHDDDDHDE